MAPKYGSVLVNSFLAAAKHLDPVLRSSAESNLGDLSGRLRYSFGPIIQEPLRDALRWNAGLYLGQLFMAPPDSGSLLASTVTASYDGKGLSCLCGLLRDPAGIVRHTAVLALGCIIKGMGQLIFRVMPHEMRQI